jgi:hypothetical protein
MAVCPLNGNPFVKRSYIMNEKIAGKGSTFRKPKGEWKKHFANTVKVYGHWTTPEMEKDFTDRVVKVFQNMSQEHHLLVTVAGKTLVVTALEMRQSQGLAAQVREVSVSQYTWIERVGTWAIVDRQALMSAKADQSFSLYQEAAHKKAEPK